MTISPTAPPHSDTATAPLRLSVLDLVPVRTSQSSAQAVAASLALARVADRSGVWRYWVAEHHNLPAVASTNPPVLVALIAGATERMRVGSGGVMLPNHAPLDVAEQFALLEAAYPGRIDLGVGRAPGSDPVTSWALRAGGPAAGAQGDVERFDEHVDSLIAMMAPEGVGLRLQGQTYELHATPHATSAPPVWLLGSSDYSARLAASRGLPYVFAHHFSGSGTEQALALYRSEFQPSSHAAKPLTFLTVNACVAETRAEAERLARPQLLAMVALRTGGPLRPQLSVEEAEDVTLSAAAADLMDSTRSRWIIGDPDQVAKEVTALAEQFGVGEVMVNPVAGSHGGDPPDRAPQREQTVRLLSHALLS